MHTPTVEENTVNAIFAVDAANGIGFKGSLPWPHNSEDLKWFKACTLSGAVVMGRKTWEDPKMPKPLPGRVNYVISSNPIVPPVAIWISSPVDVQMMAYSGKFGKPVWVIGGAETLRSLAGAYDKIVITRFHKTYECDTALDVDRLTKWCDLEVEEMGEGFTRQIWTST